MATPDTDGNPKHNRDAPATSARPCKQPPCLQIDLMHQISLLDSPLPQRNALRAGLHLAAGRAVGISLAGEGRMRFRPYPWEPQLKKQVFALSLAPRSAYILSGESRWRWQHSVPPAKELRYSITLRTRNNA